MRYYLIDKVLELQPGERARGIKNVTLSDEVLHDHFPDIPVMPGCLVLEAAAQLGGFLLEMSTNRADTPVRRAILVQIQQAKFYETSGPGDTLDIEVRLESTLETAALINAEVSVAGRRIARASLTFALRAIDFERVHEQRRSVYRLWTRHFNPPLDIR